MISILISFTLTITQLLVLVMIFLILLNKQLLFNCYKVFYIVSGSMYPTLKKGSLVIAETNYKFIERGDIVIFTTFNHQNPVVHRVIEITSRNSKTYYLTKGDANPADDRYSEIYREGQIGVQVNDIIGKVYMAFPYLGYLTGYERPIFRNLLFFILILQVCYWIFYTSKILLITIVDLLN